MTKDELMSKLTDLGTLEDDAERRAIITELTTDLNSVYDDNETLKASNKKFEDDNKKLQEYNMQLFLKVGNQTKKKEKVAEPEKKILKYENLFNEKGELK
jgi:hypothetical protein